MTLAEIRARALAQAGEQESALGEMSAVLTQYINEGLHNLCAGGLAQTRQLTVTAGECSLDEDVLDVIRVSDCMGRDKNYRLEGSTLHVVPDGTYTARLMTAPSDLAEPTDEPAIPLEYHGALADYAAWRLLSNGGKTQQARGEFYRQCAMRELIRMQRSREAMQGARRRIHKYA